MQRKLLWGGYRFVVLADNKEPDGLKVIDLGAGHSSSGETLCGRVVMVLKSQALLNESVGAGYIDRNWPPALKDGIIKVCAFPLKFRHKRIWPNAVEEQV
jgi:hypothetical protein